MSLDSKAMRGQIVIVILVLLISLPWVVFGPDKVGLSLQHNQAGELTPVILRSDRLGSQWKVQFNLSRPLPRQHNYLIELVVITADGERHVCTYTELNATKQDNGQRTVMTGFSSSGLRDVRQVEWKIATEQHPLLHMRGDWVQEPQAATKPVAETSNKPKSLPAIVDRKAAVINLVDLTAAN